MLANAQKFAGATGPQKMTLKPAMTGLFANLLSGFRNVSATNLEDPWFSLLPIFITETEMSVRRRLKTGWNGPKSWP
jgi:hypothetical protein